MNKKKTKSKQTGGKVKVPVGLPSSNWLKMQATLALKQEKSSSSTSTVSEKTKKKDNATATVVAAIIKQKKTNKRSQISQETIVSSTIDTSSNKRKAPISSTEEPPEKKVALETSDSISSLDALSLVDQVVEASEAKRNKAGPLDASALWFSEEVSVTDLKKVYGYDNVHSGTTTDEKRQRRRIERAMALESSDPTKIGKYLAIDCEMVGVGPNGVESALARVSIVNFFGHLVLDKFVKTKERVTDYRTEVSGITPTLMKKAESFESVQKAVADLIVDRIIVGHAIHNDLKALMLSHPRHLIRDTQLYKPFRKLTGGRTPSLKRLVELVLKQQIQDGAHSSIEDAAATMLLYRSCKDEWDREMGARLRLTERRKEEKRQQQQRRQRQLNAQMNATLQKTATTSSTSTSYNDANEDTDDNDDDVDSLEESE